MYHAVLKTVLMNSKTDIIHQHVVGYGMTIKKSPVNIEIFIKNIG